MDQQILVSTSVYFCVNVCCVESGKSTESGRPVTAMQRQREREEKRRRKMEKAKEKRKQKKEKGA